MALDKLTIIDGGGLSTTSDYRVGVITATKFVGPVEGSITATDATFSGNVSIAGTLTYEDVTNVDSVGIITARNGIKVSTGTATTALVVDGDARVTGILTVGTGSLTLDGPNNLVNVGTALTLGHTQGLQFHTQNLHSAGFEVNQINVSGVSTFSGGKAKFDELGNLSGRYINLDQGNGTKYIDANLANGNSISLRGYIGGSYHHLADFIRGGLVRLNYNGNGKLETSNTGVTVTGTAVATGADINGDLDVDGHTNLDNVSIAGITTFTGHIDASSDVYISDKIIHAGDVNTQIRFPAADTISFTTGGTERLEVRPNGDVAITGDKGLYFGANDDLLVGHDGSLTRISDTFGHMKISSNVIEITNQSLGENYIKCTNNAAVELYYDNDRVFFTETRGVRIGDATKIFEDSTHTSAVIQNTDIHHSIILRGSSNANGTTITPGNTTTFREYGKFVFRTGPINAQERFVIEADGTSRFVKGVDGGTDEDIAKFIPDGAVQLYYDGGNKLETTSTGIDTDTIRLAGLRFPRTQPNNGLDFMTIGHGGASGIGEIDCITNMMRIKAGEVQLANRFGNVEMLTCNSFGSVEIFHNGSKKFETSSSGATITGTLVSDGLSVGNGEHISLGNSNQFKLYHDGSNAALQTTSGNTYLYGGGGNFLIRPVNAEQGLNVIANGAVELFHNDVKVCTTTTEGIRVQGAEGGGGKVEIYADEGDDNADKWHLLANTDGTLLIRNLSDGSWDTNIKLTSTSTELYADDNKKLETTSTGIVATGNITANHSNGQVYLQASDGSIELTRTGSGAYIDFKDSTSEDYDIRINEEGGAFRVNTHFRLYDNKALELGNRTGTTYGDLRLYHDTSNSIIENYTGSLNIRNYDTNSTNINISARNNILLQTNLNETAIQCIANGAVEIFHDSGTYGTAKLQTTTTGIKINGTGLALNVDGGYIRSVGGQPTVVAHKSSSTFCHIGVENNSNARAFLAYTNDKDFIIGRRTAYTGDHTGYSGRDISIDKTNHAVDICYNGSTKFKTTSGGVDITGNMECDGITSSGGMATTGGYVNLQGTDTTKILLQGADSQLIRYRNAASTYVASITSIGNGDTFQLLNEKQSQYLNIESDGVRIGGRLTLPTTDTGIRFGPGTALNDSASIEWKGGDNAGYLRISTDDDQDVQTPAEYIEFGDYANQNRVGTFTQHVKISRSEFLVSTGTHTVSSAARFKVNQDGNTEILRQLYLTSDLYMGGELNLTTDGNKNRFIDCSMDPNEALFIRSTINGDAGHQNMALFHREGSVNLYHANSEKIATQAHGINIYGDIHMGGLSNTGTNQNRQIYWTGFDKESSGDNSDFAHIKHTTNIHGIAGSVLEIKAENDANDGIALAASSGNGQIAFVGKKVNVTGYLQPSAGSGDNGIKWPNDPFGGSGDIATMQYYRDGSGENTRLRILVANDGDDDLYLQGNGVHSQGNFTKSSGSFRVPHVLAGLTTTTDLVHSFVEGPQADNLYRGRTTLVAGISTVNIDTTNNMTEGTFVNLNRDVQCFTTNETGWTAIKGSVTGNLLTIVAQDNTCTDTISWMVIGERWDLAMYDPNNAMTDENGKVRTEIPNRNYTKGYNEDYINENKYRVGISTISRPSIENKEVE